MSTRRDFLRQAGAAGVVLAAGDLAGGCTPRARPQNVVLIFTDDQGWGDVGVYGAQGFTTPHLDRLAAEGMRFTDFYASQAVCSASRAALLTGCYSERVSVLGALGPGSTVGLNPDETTIAEMLKPLGYATGCFGKWHLGHLPQFLVNAGCCPVPGQREHGNRPGSDQGDQHMLIKWQGIFIITVVIEIVVEPMWE